MLYILSLILTCSAWCVIPRAQDLRQCVPESCPALQVNYIDACQYNITAWVFRELNKKLFLFIERSEIARLLKQIFIIYSNLLEYIPAVANALYIIGTSCRYLSVICSFDFIEIIWVLCIVYWILKIVMFSIMRTLEVHTWDSNDDSDGQACILKNNYLIDFHAPFCPVSLKFHVIS